jgi:hypothetical protein
VKQKVSGLMTRGPVTMPLEAMFDEAPPNM